MIASYVASVFVSWKFEHGRQIFFKKKWTAKNSVMCEISSGNLFLSEHPTHPWATKWFERVGVKFAIPKPSVEEDISDFRGWWAMIFCMCSSLVFIHKHPTKLDYTFHVFWPWTGFSDGSDQWGRIEWTRGRKGKKKGLEKNNTNFQRGGQWTFVLFF